MMKKIRKIYSKIKKSIKKYIKKIKNIRIVLIRVRYTNYYEKESINSNFVLAQAYGGMNFYGNIFYLLKEMISRKDCENFVYFVGARKEEYESTKKFVKYKFGNQVTVLLMGSKKYLKVLASAKYLLNNVGFPTYFIKKQGQVYLNTWHGTPLKGLGRGIMDAPNESGNYQRNFLMSDYILFPNEYTFNCMREDYMLNNLYTSKYILHGYPRNSVFYENNNTIKNKYNPENNEIIVYMPTWRRKSKDSEEDEQIKKCIELLDYLDKNLKNNQILYVKLHNLVNNKINFDNYTKVKTFPFECETYEFLSISDALITDYSSVMFDYMNSGKKIILYTYDLDEYTNGRGFYFDIKELPFPLCYKIEEVLKETKKLKSFNDYKEFKKKYCDYDGSNVSKDFIDLLLYNKSNNIEIIDGKEYNNKKKKVLLYTGNLSINILTYNLLNSLEELSNDFNYYLNFYNTEVNKNKFVINEIPKHINYITLQGQRLITLKEAICHRLYYNFNLKNNIIMKNINKLNEREIKRLFPNLEFDYLLVYRYKTRIINMYSAMKGKKILFINKSLISNKKEHLTYKEKINKFEQIYLNNKILNNQLVQEYNYNGNIDYYGDRLNEFKKFIKDVVNNSKNK